MVLVAESGTRHDLEQWHPRLIGSVWSGHARRGSDIDLHLFGELDAICSDLGERRWPHAVTEVLIRVSGDFRLYYHVHLLERWFPVEISVYPFEERRTTTRSSVDKRPVERISAARLEERLRQEHAYDFAQWERTGVLEFHEEDDRGPFGSLL